MHRGMAHYKDNGSKGCGAMLIMFILKNQLINASLQRASQCAGKQMWQLGNQLLRTLLSLTNS